MFEQLVAGLQHLQDRGYMHCDIKLDNALVTSTNPLVVKLADLGGAKPIRDPNQGNGTAGYMAPEVLLWRATAPAQRVAYDEEKADVWSLGVLLLGLKFGVQFRQLPFYPNTRVYHVLEQAQKDGHNGVLAVARIGHNQGYAPWQYASPLQGNPRLALGNLLDGALGDLLNWMLHHDPAQRLDLQQVAQHPWVVGGGGGGVGGGG